MQSSIPPTGSAMPPLPQKKRRWPWLLAGCGCLTLIGLGCGALVLAYLGGYLGNQSSQHGFGKNEWKRDGQEFYAQFLESKKQIYFEVAGEKYHGVVHAGGYYRIEGNTLIYRLTWGWVDVGRGGGADDKGEISSQAREELGFNREEKRRVAWIDPDTFRLGGSWFSSNGDIWRRQSKADGGMHYSAGHDVPEHWVDGRGWVPDSTRSPATVPRTSSSPQAQTNAAISANYLWKAYQDEGAADKLYKGKVLTVSGRIYFAGVPMYQKTVMVSLKDDQGSDRVVCAFPTAAKDAVTALKEDQQVTIRGRCDGAISHTAVQLKDCELVTDQAPRSNTTTTKPGPSIAPQEEELIRFKPYIAMAAKVWLQILDTGDYSASYDTAGPTFRRGTTVEQWHKALSQMRKLFGTVKSRDPNAIITRSDSTSNGTTTSTYRVEIHTTFTKRNGTETITVIPESGDFKVSDYTIDAAR
ncbi:MAG: hypothetical protein QOD80_133 [Verrucomicrobiota bacterium]